MPTSSRKYLESGFCCYCKDLLHFLSRKYNWQLTNPLHEKKSLKGRLYSILCTQESQLEMCTNDSYGQGGYVVRNSEPSAMDVNAINKQQETALALADKLPYAEYGAKHARHVGKVSSLDPNSGSNILPSHNLVFLVPLVLFLIYIYDIFADKKNVGKVDEDLNLKTIVSDIKHEVLSQLT
eukprot:XP_014630274.1 uncharacterized protein LOC100793742 isoform X2 [Glycine max]